MTGVKGWLGALRSAGKDATSEAHERVHAETRLWKSHASATVAATQVLESTAALSASSTKQRKLLEALIESVRGNTTRAEEAGPALARVSEAFERMRLVALNIGLEGSRLGDGAGRALALVSDEIRAYVERGNDALRDVQTLIEEMRPSMGQLADRCDQLRQSDTEQGQEVVRLQSLAQATARSVEDMAESTRKLAQTDPETATIVARASEHARGLISDLSLLNSAAQGELARGVLRPLVEPLGRLLKQLGSGGP